jgi:uncharacterized protein
MNSSKKIVVVIISCFLIVFVIGFSTMSCEGSVQKFTSPRTLAPDTIPAPVGYVNDFEYLFTGEQEILLDSLIRDFEKKTTIQIAILTLDTSFTADSSFDDFIVRVASKWGVGQQGK